MACSKFSAQNKVTRPFLIFGMVFGRAVFIGTEHMSRVVWRGSLCVFGLEMGGKSKHFTIYILYWRKRSCLKKKSSNFQPCLVSIIYKNKIKTQLVVLTGDKNLDSLCPKCLDVELILLLTELPYSQGLGKTSG